MATNAEKDATEPVCELETIKPDLLTYSMVQSPSWEANWFAASQEIPRRFITALRHLSLSWASLIKSIYPHPTFWRSIPYYPPIYAYVSPVVSFPPVYPPRPCTPLSPNPYVPHAQPISFFSILSPAKYWVSSTGD